MGALVRLRRTRWPHRLPLERHVAGGWMCVDEAGEEGVERKLGQEQSLAELEQGLGNRERLLGDRAQASVDADQIRLDSDRDEANAADSSASRP